MRPISKVFFFSLVIFLFFFLPALAGQLNSEFDLKSKTMSGSNLITNSIIDDFLVNDDTGTADQRFPAIAIDGSGKFVVTWDDCRTGASNGVYAQRYGATGYTVGSNFRVNDDTVAGYSESFPSIAMDLWGNFVITWEDHRYGWNIYAQRYNSSGTPLDSNFEVNDDAGFFYQWFPAIAGQGSGGFVIVWVDDRTDPLGDIYAQRYDSSGTPIGPNFQVNDDAGTSYQWFPAIAMGDSGDFVIMWEDRRNGGDDPDIYAKMYDSSGTQLDTSFKVNDDAGTRQYSPAVAMDGSSNFVVAWKDYRTHSHGDIYAQMYDSLGARVGSNFKVNDDTGDDTGSVGNTPLAVAMAGSGKFVITWDEKRNGTSDIYAQKYNSSGDPLDSNYLVPNLHYASFAQEYPAVAANDDSIYFTWQDNRRAKGWDIYAKVVDWIWTEVDENEEVNLPHTFELSQNYPNPFNPSTTIQFRVQGLRFREPVHTTLRVYNILGQLVRTLVDEEKPPGNYTVIWDGKDEKDKEVASGIYFYQLKTKDYTATRKMILLR